MWDVPFVGVNHLEAHLYAAFLDDPALELPVVYLLVSGGHTMLVHMEGHGRYRLLGQTIDDAAGEAFDKVARYLGLGYPGGPAIDRVADRGRPRGHPRSPGRCSDDSYDFSFSGLKTAVINHVRKHPEVATRRRRRQLPGGGGRRAGRQGPPGRRARSGAKGMCLGGGVAANSLLRERFLDACTADGLHAFVPEPGDVHRQRRHGGGGRPLAPAAATARRPSTPAATRTSGSPSCQLRLTSSRASTYG